MSGHPSDRRHAAGVAAVATTVGTVCFVVLVLILNAVLLGRLNSQVDTRLRQRLVVVEDVLRHSNNVATSLASVAGDADSDDVPIYVWRISGDGAIHAYTDNSPRLPRATWVAGETTLVLSTSKFRFSAVALGRGWLVAGESLADVTRLDSFLSGAEVTVGAVLAVLMFLAAYVVGMRALTPVALARRRQTEFTSDASHELRTPLSVIEAEVDLALSRRRDAESYRMTIERIGGEGRRLRRIVDDLLWLARSDEGHPATDASGPSDVTVVAAEATERFSAIARTMGVDLRFTSSGPPSLVGAPGEAVDRLVGVLVDNACKFAGSPGRVDVTVTSTANRVRLIVDDSGPGIPVEERDAVFDRFRRAESTTVGTGLGLAIARAVAAATHAECVVHDSPLGGARFEVTWRRAT